MRYKLTLLKTLPDFPSGTEISLKKDDIDKGYVPSKYYPIIDLMDNSEWVKLEEDPRCDCLFDSYISILSRTIGYGKSAGCGINFERKRISGWVSVACDSDISGGIDIKYCPFCGRELSAKDTKEDN